MKQSFRQLYSFLIGHEKTGALVFYILAVSFVYSPVVFFNRSLQSAVYHPYTVTEEGAYGYEGRRPFGAFNVDVSNATITDYPINKLVGDTYRQGQWPLWNPYKGIGQPLPEQFGQSVFFPYQILQDISPVESWDFFMLGRLLIAGFFTFLFLRSVGISKISSLFGGLAYMFSGAFTWFINNEEMTNPAMMIPVVLWSVENLLQNANFRTVALAAISLGLILTAGTPGVSLYALLLVFSYYLFRVVGRGSSDPAGGFLKSRPGLVLVFLVVFLLGLGLAAPLLMPSFDFLNSAVALRAELGSAIVSAKHFGFVLFPGLADIPVEYRFGVLNGFWDAIGNYTGILPVYFALLGLIPALLFKSSFRKYLLFFLAFALAVLLKNYGIFPFVLIGKLPLLETVWSPRWSGPVWGFSLAVAGALGLDLIRQFGHQLRQRFNKLFRPVLLLVAALVGLLFIGIYQRHLSSFLLEQSDKILVLKGYSFSDQWLYLAVTAVVLLLATFLVSSRRQQGQVYLALLALLGLELWFWIPRGWELAELKSVPFIFGALAVTLLLWRPMRRPLVFLILSFTAFNGADLISPHGLPSRFDAFKTPPYITYLRGQAGNFRTLGTGGVLMPNYASAYGISDLRHIDATTERNFFLFKRDVLGVDEYPFWFFNFATALSPPDRVSFPLLCGGRKYSPARQKSIFQDRLPSYSLLGVKHLLVPRNLTISDVLDVKEPHDFPLVYDGEVKIYENPHALPRAFIVSQIEWSDSPNQAQEKLKELTLADLKRKVFLEGPARQIVLTGASGGEATIKSYSPSKVEIEATGGPGILTLTDLFYPGWQATVDGNLTKVYRVNGLFRGVYLEPGRHQVVFEYQPPGFRAGLAVAGLTLLALSLLFLAFKYPGGPPAQVLQSKIWAGRTFLLTALILVLALTTYRQALGLSNYLAGRSFIHGDPGSVTEVETKKRVLKERRRREMNFVTQHLAKLLPYPGEERTTVYSFRFPPSSANPFYVIFNDQSGKAKRALIRVIKKDDPEYGYSRELEPLVDYMFGDYFESGKFRQENIGTLPPFFVQDIKSVKFIRALFFFWEREDKILETRLYVSLNYAELEDGNWVLKLGKEDNNINFTDGFQYDCQTADWRKVSP